MRSTRGQLEEEKGEDRKEQERMTEDTERESLCLGHGQALNEGLMRE